MSQSRSPPRSPPRYKKTPAKSIVEDLNADDISKYGEAFVFKRFLEEKSDLLNRFSKEECREIIYIVTSVVLILLQMKTTLLKKRKNKIH